MTQAVRTAALDTFKHPPSFNDGSNWTLWDIWYGANLIIASPDLDSSDLLSEVLELCLHQSGAPDTGDKVTCIWISCPQVISTSPPVTLLRHPAAVWLTLPP